MYGAPFLTSEQRRIFTARRRRFDPLCLATWSAIFALIGVELYLAVRFLF